MSTSIASSAQIGSDTKLGSFCVVEDDVRIGSGCRIGHHVVLRSGTHIGDNVRIDDHSSIGKQPMRAANSSVTDDEKQPPATVGHHAIIGSQVVIYAGAHVGARTLVADMATVRERVAVGEFTIVGRGVAIENDCRVGRYCKLETNAYLTAYSTLEDHVFVAPGVLTSNDNYMGRTERRFEEFGGLTARRGARLGVGSVVLPGREIGEEGVLAAGALLTRDLPPRTIYAGVPAERFREVPDEQLLRSDP